MRPFGKIPIKRKVTFVILLTCSLTLLVATSALFVFEMVNFRKNFTRDLGVLAKIIANQSTAAVQFRNDKDAAEILAALKANRQILSACIRLSNGSILGRYGEPEGRSEWSPRSGSGFHFEGGHLYFNEPIVLDGETIGTLQLQSDYQKIFWQLLRLYAIIFLVVLVSSILVAFLLSLPLQQLITLPILRLADTVKTIADKKDYSVRAEKIGEEELALFTEAFNQMLTQIQSQDKALRESEYYYRLLFKRSPLPMWVHDQKTLRFLAVNDSTIEHYGYSQDELLSMTIKEIFTPEEAEKLIPSIGGGQEKADSVGVWCHRKKDGTLIDVESTSHPIDFHGNAARLVLANDITTRKKAESELATLHRKLLETSRQAGMAEVATGVLHNVGNVLNSVNVSATLVRDRLRESKVANLTRVVALLQIHKDNMGAFMTTDPKGKLVPDYLERLEGALLQEREDLLREISLLAKNVDHIKEIVAMQQSYAKVSGFMETLPVVGLVEDALRINEAGLERHGIEIERDYAEVPSVTVDKHKTLQILINLVQNAKYALDGNASAAKKLYLGVTRQNPDRVRIIVRDNGVGIPPENLTKIFSHGFTTRRSGHGFGLHSGALSAKEMGGELSAHSDGPGCGATFILDLPITQDSEKERGKSIGLKTTKNA